MNNELQIIRLTKKYIIDFLNALFFANTVSWDSDDQYNMLPILSEAPEENGRYEQRGALFVHKKYSQGLKLLVTVQEHMSYKIAYRIKNITEKIPIDNPRKTIVPFDSLEVDFSIADLNLGMEESTAYSFHDNVVGGNNSIKLFSLLRFLLNSSVIAVDNKELFEGLLLDTLSQPPVAGDIHYSPIFGVVKAE